MDLGTVKKNLIKGKLQTYEDFFNEMQLIWDNCKLYNMAGSEIHKLSEHLEKIYKKQSLKAKQLIGLT